MGTLHRSCARVPELSELRFGLVHGAFVCYMGSTSCKGRGRFVFFAPIFDTACPIGMRTEIFI